MTTDMRNPVEVKNDPWIHAFSPESQEPGDYVGKWMPFVGAQYVPETWAKIREATNSGNLGIEAKISTAMNNNGNAYVICIYTYDARDIEDVRRVLMLLRKIGFNGRLNYKEDNATIAFLYARKGGPPASLYTSPQGDFIKTLRTIIEPGTEPDIFA